MAAMEPLDVRSLAVYGDEDKIIGVNESGVKAALEKGLQEELSQLQPSQWGMVHLFDLCLRFSLIGTASALARHGVPGCFLEGHHRLGQFCKGYGPPICRCQGYSTCRYCCWTFPVKQGIRMANFDMDLEGAIAAAWEAAATPLTRAMLDISSCDMGVPFSGPPKTMARLLDIAILTGNQKAAINLSKKCHVKPLRRWALKWSSEACCWGAARTALCAGANFQDFMVEGFPKLFEDVPFPQALFLKSKLEEWQEVHHLLPRCHGLWRPRKVDYELKKVFFERSGKKLSLDKLRAAKGAGVDLGDFADEVRPHQNYYLRSLVLYDEDLKEEKIVGVNESGVKAALEKGLQEELSKLLPSQWGMVHLFDLCLRFTHVDTALALAMHGVPGCVLGHRRLGPFSSRDSWGWGSHPPCSCRDRNPCSCCCWAFPVEQGIWMEDWDVELFYSARGVERGAISAAREAAATPLTRAMLDLCSRDIEVPFSGSREAMARLLDIAILTGNQKAAIDLSKKCHVKPLRRWALKWSSEACCWGAVGTALCAGADFQDLMVEGFPKLVEGVPFPQALFLKSFEDWQKIRHLLPRCHGLWRPRNLNNNLGELFLERPHGPGGSLKLSLGKIRAAKGAGVDLQSFAVEVRRRQAKFFAWVTLLDVAIWGGQPDCAEACVELLGHKAHSRGTLVAHQRVLRGEGQILNLNVGGRLQMRVTPHGARIAAAAAGRAWLKRLWIVLDQVFPMNLVKEILTFSITCPKIIDQFEHVSDWMAKKPPSVALGNGGSQISGRDGLDRNGRDGLDGNGPICNENQPKRRKIRRQI